MSTQLELGDIQGLAVRGYRMPCARFRSYRFAVPAAGRAWLGALVDPITTAAEWSEKPDACVNVALSYPGLEALGIEEDTLSGFPRDFVEGMAARGQDKLGDVGPNSPDLWEPAFRDRAVHALLMVWAQNEGALEVRLGEADALCPAGVGLLDEQPAGALDDRREHFGYRDGISQPAIVGDGEPRPGQAGPVQPGEFILGYPDEIEQTAGSELRRELRSNSTYLVYRKLRQDVAGFRALLRAHAHKAGGEERLAAKLVGRWRSGAPIVLAPDTDDPALADDEKRNNDFNYERDDPRGLACPRGAHIRRSWPRVPGRERRLLIRRGLPYGPRLPEDAPDDGHDRGLVGMFLCANIQRQFEFVQQIWLNDPRFDGLSNGPDPLVGSGGTFTIQGRLLPRRVTGMPRFVTVRGGEYLLLPSVSALKWLAT
ncbi:MAG: Dyp-type peroxidase [Egibacteraceae bacterium]